MQEKEYIQMLIRSLEKKIAVLKNIQELNGLQTELLQQEDVEMNKWQELIDKKAVQIDEINFLDEGFQNLYERVKEELGRNKEAYRDEILVLQKLITEITELGVNIQVQEERNRQLAQKQFAGYKKKVHQFKENKKVMNLYKNQMRKTSVVEAQFLDKKN